MGKLAAPLGILAGSLLLPGIGSALVGAGSSIFGAAAGGAGAAAAGGAAAAAPSLISTGLGVAAPSVAGLTTAASALPSATSLTTPSIFSSITSGVGKGLLSAAPGLGLGVAGTLLAPKPPKAPSPPKPPAPPPQVGATSFFGPSEGTANSTFLSGSNKTPNLGTKRTLLG